MATLLLVEDDSNQQILYRQELEEAGHRVIVAGTVREAFSVLRREDVEVMVLDLALPTLENGLNIFEMALSEFPHVRIIVHTGYDLPASERTSRCASGFVVKSSDLRHLKRKIEQVLEWR